MFNALLPGENFLPPKGEEAAEDEVEDIEVRRARAKQCATMRTFIHA